MPPTASKTRKIATGAKPQATAIPPSNAVSQFSIGDEITHPQFGDGKVTDVDGDKLAIEFTDGRVKHIVDSYVKRRKT
jgi:DNA helicase-2/ATP-dependent DNA helicase PcrA